MSRPFWRARTWRKALGIAALIGIAAAGCTRTSVPVGGTAGAQNTPAVIAPERTGVPFGFGRPSEIEYAVVWIGEAESLAVRVPAGISGTEIADYSYDDRGLQLTGNALFLGSSLWVEVDSPVGLGWVNSSNLTESIAPDVFCSDARVVPVLQSFLQAIDRRDGQALLAMVTPKRGLVLRHDWWNPEISIPLERVPLIFVDETEYEWGAGDTLGSPVTGTFSEVFAPELTEMARGSPTVTCNSLVIGSTARPPSWPAEYVNLNYYTFFVPDPSSERGFNWRSWAFAVEYVEGQPYIAVIVQYRGEI